ncbi:phosphatidylinositol phosphate synthase [Zhihengliuella flava]|uniref:Phosphatidylinositol phosphate synthase n=1 Tax=Zhihengliuella flava TaxID=1285193 RepID=A0A931D6T5_9MICC|nr:CDP-alcohol phosphatidyltransferase family protein [Zhihengliuella flava]MBG6083469.1 CDP-diacylglycerol--glycerol-3-phosphate 3-phosphatidyltransferase [Zhihengliuella flava]
MLNTYARDVVTRIMSPLARWLLAHGVTPDAVTCVGTVGVMAAALILYPLGYLFAGTMVITVFVLADLLDGTMARLPQWRERSGSHAAARQWGSFLDSSLDRLADGAIFGGIALWYFTTGQAPATGAAAVACLFLGSVVSYVRAKAESLGYDANVGIAERAERLVVALTVVGLDGLGLPPVIVLVALTALAAASAVTIVQRGLRVRQQVREAL